MKKTPEITTITTGSGGHDNGRRRLSPGAVILELKRENNDSRGHAKRLARFARLAETRERVIHRMLDKSLEIHDRKKGPHLTVIK